VRWFRNTAFSLRALNRARVRTMLSACSMTIGIAAMFILFSLGAGAEKVFEDALASMGKNLLAVGSVRQQTDALRGQGRRVQTLTLDDWRAISSEVAGVERAAPIAMNNFDVRYGGRATNVTVIGTTPEYRYSNVHHPSLGRFFDDVDIQSQARVAVIGPQIAKELFFGEQPIGERLLIGGAPYEVIGVLQAKGTDAGGVPQDDKILVPVTTAMRRLLNVDFIDRIFVQAETRESVSKVIDGVRDLLRRRHALDISARPDDFTIRDQAELVRTIRRCPARARIGAVSRGGRDDCAVGRAERFVTRRDRHYSRPMAHGVANADHRTKYLIHNADTAGTRATRGRISCATCRAA